jgi:phage-related protein
MAFFLNEKVVIETDEGTITFNDPTDVGDLTGAEQAWIDGLEGWTNTVKPVVVSSQKAVGDGAYVAPKFYAQGRTLVAAGMVATLSEADTDDAWTTLGADAFPLNSDVKITCYGPRPRYVTARVISDLRLTQFMPLGFRFEVDLLCADPYKYDAVNVLTGTSGIVGSSTGGMVWPLKWPLTFGTTSSGSGNQVTLTNIGNANTYPVTTITGPLDQGWRLENSTTGDFLSFNVALSAGQQLVIDHAKETATINGSSVSGLIDGDWWPLIRGTNIIKLFGNYYADASFTVTARSAWR